MIIAIDSSKCIGCSKCTKVCPLKVIEMNDQGKAEAVRPNFCVRCAHCMSVCSNNAISTGFTESIPGRSTENINVPTTEQVENFMLTRRSIRAYLKKDVDREKIERILRIAVHAPTARNAQNVKFQVIGLDKVEELETIAHNYYRGQITDNIGVITREAGFKVLLGAPVTIALYAEKSDKGNANEALWNCLIATQNLLLAAHGMGLGGCYNGLLLHAYRNDFELQKFFNIAEDMEMYMFVELGYPDPMIKYLKIIDRQKPNILWK